MSVFREKERFAKLFYQKYKLRFTNKEMSHNSLEALERIGKHKVARMKIAQRDRAAATLIQKIWRGYFIRK